MMKYVEKNGDNTHSAGCTYDSINNLTALVETINGVKRTTSYTYDNDNRPISVTNGDSTRSYSYDNVGRLSQDVTKQGSTDLFTRNFTYCNGATSTQVGQINYAGNNYSTYFNYSYETRDLISSVATDGSIVFYDYDDANQLIRERVLQNGQGMTTTCWTYDDAGNILKREVYPYGQDSDPSARISEVDYTYSDSDWGDLLTSYNGVPIAYDGIGNPLNDGTWTYTWQHGRQLASMSKIGTTELWDYTYNADGLRTQRKKTGTDSNITYNYTYLGGQLTHMTVGEHTMYFAYDASGVPLSLTYDGETYYYVTNLQGDVVSILNSSGAEVVTYAYDAWGNLVSTTCDEEFADLGFYNPLRYRGYVYDEETGLYYLQSRYYNPEMGRFINADSAISGAGGDILGYNMFTYCFNNPMNMSDSTGNWPKWLEKTVKIASVVVAVAAVVVTVAAVSYFTAGTGSAAAVYGATILLGAALSGINGGIANESKGNSYINGYLGGATGGAIQSACSKYPGGTTVGGGVGVTVGTTVTDIMNNLDPDSKNSTAQEIASNAIISGGKALVTSSITEYVGTASDLAVDTGANGLMPTYTFGFGEAVKSFFGWGDDALVYIWE